MAIPVGLLLAYGGARVLSVVFQELREFLFVNVAQRAIRRVALVTFRHLHSLSLRFHLDRQTGGLSRVIERGVKGIEFVLSFMLFNIIPRKGSAAQESASIAFRTQVAPQRSAPLVHRGYV